MTVGPSGDDDWLTGGDDFDLSDLGDGGEATRLSGGSGATGPSGMVGQGDAAGAGGGKGGVWEGDTLKNRFVLEKCLGVGGMGTVFKALDLRKQEAMDRNPYLAVKILNADFRGHPESLRTLQREAKKAQNLSHENIVKVFDFDRDGDQVYMIMEYLDGEALDLRTKQAGFRGMPPEVALRIIADVGSALAYAHESGIVHCDFKPANIILTHDGPAKVIDFGIARAVKREDAPQEDQTLFDAGDLGAYTLAYASLEILERQDPDPRDDVYALACIAYELITGKHPYNRLSAAQAIENKIQPERPKALNGAQWAALKKGLALKRSQRSKSVKELLDGLGKSGGGAGHKLLLFGALAALLIAGGVGAYVFLAASDPQSQSQQVADDAGADQMPSSNEEQALDQNNQGSGDIVSAENLAEQLGQSADLSTGNGKALTPTTPETQITPEIQTPPSTQVASDAGTSTNAGSPSIAALPPLSADTVEPLVRRIDCAALDVQTAGGTAVVSGYARDPEAVAALDSQLQGMPGFVDLRTAVAPIPATLCGPLDFFKPYDTLNMAANFGMKVAGQKPENVYFEGESLVLNVVAPPFNGYLYVDYFLQDGTVYHLMPGATYGDNYATAGSRLAMGDAGSGVTWSISPPFGTEMITVIGAPQQLVTPGRPELESNQGYLSALRSGLEAVYNAGQGNQVAADIYFLTTQPRP